ncbi:Lrp/AsnC family transcriptional regulator [Maridesulfovibrio hydrothermalis]|uniref:Transcriptional regulator, AsnC family n=1 Tax=Maridesulfovibrio hydrothermalis AM13 = DSM 14728 TaxID=1121451 RepID=L0RGM8_9BACT|nr:Lrp/AsnC family transcriptional regulator [Maridesulfovibrio hydrothermalis]CCO25387.1 Transcriptional regulator, AsnC family [Maridesulfovibrio hydrothermalis AM13 = DSM 14728]
MKERPLVLDEVDRRIIEELQRNGRESYKNIARKLGVSDGTVRLRTERMIKNDYLRITASVNPLYFENSLIAMVGINLEERANPAIMEKISKVNGVQSVINVSGRFDLLVEVFVQSRNAFRQFLVDDLSNVGCIKSTETFMFLDAIDKWAEHKE